MSRTIGPAHFAALCEIPSSQAADHDNLPGWNDAPDSEKDSPSTGNNNPGQSPKLACNQPDGSPTSEAASPQVWASDALPITQAPGVGSDSPGMYASLAEGDTASLEDSLAEEGQAVTPVPQAVTTPMLHTEASPVVSALKGAAADSSLRPQTMLGTISRVVFKPLGFGRFATGMWTKRAADTSKAGMAASEALGVPLSPTLEHGPATAEGSIDTGSPSAIEARLLSRLPPSPRAEAIKQGLHIIEQAHQQGPEALQLQAPEIPAAGFGPIAPEVVMGRGDSAVAEAISQAVQTPRDVAAAVVAVQLDGSCAKASLPPSLEGTELGASIAQESIAAAQAAVQQGAAGGDVLSDGPSRKRSAEQDEPGEEAGGAAQPRRRRRLRTGMEVVWKFFGLNKPET
ncbi:hypothetical protein WJX75_008273 [Coccomyxa subellipsoidea]|uniref:Uncharacterized protein n=1 Tax=Coccomyxa subellipsoidea TaxID=248742 RepID=A0ABR2YZN2_9CHLO